VIRPSFPGTAALHVTLEARSGSPSLRSARFVHEIERSFARACERGSFRGVHVSLQPDHVHLIVEARSPAA
jgi:REP element-mobilizing transposase RayT